jgi:hypothetical protein
MTKRKTVRAWENYYEHQRGCHVNPVRLGCLTCPLATCIYDLPSHYRQIAKGQATQARVLEVAQAAGIADVAAIASAAGVSLRHAYRILQPVRQGAAA